MNEANAPGCHDEQPDAGVVVGRIIRPASYGGRPCNGDAFAVNGKLGGCLGRGGNPSADEREETAGQNNARDFKRQVENEVND